MKKGFTLVELSIVLMIIGLLVGGILTAQELITSAKINTLSKETSQYDIAMKIFKEKYKYLPGDFPAEGFGVEPGNGNDTIVAGDEGIAVWIMLNAADILDFECQNGCENGVAAVPGVNVPSISWSKGSGISVGLDIATGKNTFFLGKQEGGLAMAVSPFIDPVNAMAFDKKFDDGQPYTGSILSVGEEPDSCVTFAPPYEYVISDQVECSMNVFLK